MANRYWVGGTGTWSSSSTTNWSTTSGGAGGASVPTSADDVFFNANSNIGTGAFTVTLSNNPRVCRDITISGLDGNMTLSGSVGLTVSGSLSFPATGLTCNVTGDLTFNSSTTGRAVTTNGINLICNVIFNGAGGWTLLSALSITSTLRSLTVTRGSVTTNGYNVTVPRFYIGVGTQARTVNLNSSTITVSQSTSAWDATTTTNLTFNAGTSTINLSSFIPTFTGGNLTYYNVNFSSTSYGTKTLNGSNTFNNLSTGVVSDASSSTSMVLNGNNTVNGTLSINTSAGNIRYFVYSSVVRAVRTFTCNGSTSLSNVDFQDIAITGSAAPVSGTRLGDRVNNAGITFTTPKTVYWNRALGGNWNTTSWATSSGGAVSNDNFPLPQDTAIIEDAGLNASATITLNLDFGYPSFDASTRTNAWNLLIAQNSFFYGNFAINTAVTFTGSSRVLNFSNESTKTFDSGGKVFNIHNINLGCPSTAGGLQLVNSNASFTSGSPNVILQGGTLDLNNLTLSTFASFVTTSVPSSLKNLTFNGGTLIVRGTSFLVGSASFFTTTAGTGSGVISLTSTATKTFTGAGVTFNCALDQGASGDLVIAGSNTFDDITSSVQPATILFTAGTTQTVNNFSLSGTSGNLIIIDSTTASPFTLSKASGTVSVSFLDIRDSNATGGATWEAFTSNGNIDGGNNTGWIFAGAPPVDVFVTGVAGTGDVGIVSVEEGVGVLVSGVASTGDVGVVSIQGTADIVVSGVAGTGDVGTVSITGTSSLTLTGVASTGDVGIVSVEEGTDVSVTGLQATGFVGTVALFSSTIAFPVGVQALCLVGDTIVWGPVDDSDTANWVPVNDSNGASWTPVNDSNGASWTPVNNSNGASWTPVNDSNGASWTPVPN